MGRRKFKVVYWLRGNLKTVEVEAYSKYDADDIDHIEAVNE